MANELFNTLNEILAKTNFEDITSEKESYEELPEGYYLCEVEKAELTTSSKGNVMAAFTMKVVENGLAPTEDDGFIELAKTANRKLWKYFVLKDETSVKRFASNMLKFEGEDGEPLLSREYFMSSELLEDALNILVGSRLYIQVQITEKDGKNSTWYNFISWKRADLLGLESEE